jgi:coenzyme F420-reducing hydrogenase delta subunit
MCEIIIPVCPTQPKTWRPNRPIYPYVIPLGSYLHGSLMNNVTESAINAWQIPADTQGPSVTAFICTNGAREGRAPSAIRERPPASPVIWPFAVHEIQVPCSGRIQPEHLLKVFENGADLVCVIGCEPGNCHNLEGSTRAQRRIEYVQKILAEIGLDERRLMWFSLPGSAREDMAAAIGEQPAAKNAASYSTIAAEIARQVKDRVESLTPNPLAEKV